MQFGFVVLDWFCCVELVGFVCCGLYFSFAFVVIGRFLLFGVGLIVRKLVFKLVIRGAVIAFVILDITLILLIVFAVRLIDIADVMVGLLVCLVVGLFVYWFGFMIVSCCDYFV